MTFPRTSTLTGNADAIERYLRETGAVVYADDPATDPTESTDGAEFHGDLDAIAQVVKDAIESFAPNERERALLIAIGYVQACAEEGQECSLEDAMLFAAEQIETGGSDPAASEMMYALDGDREQYAEFSESEHPRDEDGKFTGGSSGSAAGNASESKSESEPKQTRIEKLKAAVKAVPEKLVKAREAIREKGVAGASKDATIKTIRAVKGAAKTISTDLQKSGYPAPVAHAIAGFAAVLACTPFSIGSVAAGVTGIGALAMIPGFVEAGTIVKGAQGAAKVIGAAKRAAMSAMHKDRPIAVPFSRSTGMDEAVFEQFCRANGISYAKAAQIGERRTRKGGVFEKTANGWKKVKAEGSGDKKAASASGKAPQRKKRRPTGPKSSSTPNSTHVGLAMGKVGGLWPKGAGR